MISKIWTILATASLLAGTFCSPAQAEGLVGAGVHYWQTVDEVDIAGLDIDENGLSFVFSAQFIITPFARLEGAVEVFPDTFYGADETVFSPQAYFIVGSGLYGALGVGNFFADGTFSEEPFFALRAGLEVPVAGVLYLDVNINYRFTELDSLGDLDEEVDTDTVTLGAAVRLPL